MQAEHDALVRRIFSASEQVTNNINGPTKESYLLMHEMQLIILRMLVPHLLGLGSLDTEAISDGEKSGFTSGDFIITCINKLLHSEQSNFLSFAHSLKIYSETVKGMHNSENHLAQLDFTDKKTVLAAFHLLHVTITHNSYIQFATQLENSGNPLSIEFSEELTQKKALKEPSSMVRKEAMNTVMGSSNDGIGHLLAAIDISWDHNPNATPKERIQKAIKLIRHIMEKYQSWEIQFLDTMLLINKNPYQMSPDGEIEETEEAKELLFLAKKLKKNKRYKLEDMRDILLELKRRMNLPKQDIDLAFAICDATIIRCQQFGMIDPSVYFYLLNELEVTKVEYFIRTIPNLPQNIKNLILSKKNDMNALQNALTLAQTPAKMTAAVSRGQNDNPAREPKCLLLTVNQGLSNWISALIESMEALQSYQDKKSNTMLS